MEGLIGLTLLAMLVMAVWSIIDIRRRPLSASWDAKRRSSWTSIWVVSWICGALLIVGPIYILGIRSKLQKEVAAEQA